MKAKSIGFMGGGRITRIILQGYKNANIKFPSIVVCDKDSDTLQGLKRRFDEIKIADSASGPASQDIVFIALHPPDIGPVVSELKNVIDHNLLVISLAPKLSIGRLSSLLGTKRIVRLIPNATSIINQGYNPVCFSDEVSESEKVSLLEILDVLGNTFETEEHKLEAYAIVSAMLPTYFWFQWLEIQKIGQQIGLSTAESEATVFESLKASLELLYASNLANEEVLDLIPVKPISANEQTIREIYNEKLNALFDKIKPE